MSELTVTLLRLGYLALLWIFVLTAISVLRRDLYGTKIVSRRMRRSPAGRPAPAPAGPPPPPPPPPPPNRRQPEPHRLVVTAGPLTGTTLPLGAAAILIGRAQSCTLVLDDDYSSSRHARLFSEDGQWYVEDLGSTNGTFLGHDRVTDPVPVGVGAQVRIGQSVLELQR